MKKAIFLCLMSIALMPIRTSAQEYQSFFPPEEFKARWEKVFEKIGSEAVVIVQGAPDPGGYIIPRQTNEFYYLCGVENPFSYLLLDGRTKKAILFLSRAIGSGDSVLSTRNPDVAKQLTGVDSVTTPDRLTIPRVRYIYTLFSPAESAGQTRADLQSRDSRILSDPWDGRISRETHFVSLLMARNPRAEIKDLTLILDEMRSIKSPREIEVMRRAGQLAAQAVIEAMRAAQPGMYEYQLEAVARYTFIVNGVRLEGYRSILPAGVKNIGDMHYYFNSSQLKDGDLVLMDYAPDCGYYTSDIGRMFPVNGTFSPWQREICQFILEYHKAIIQRIRPGVTTRQILDEVKIAMEPVFIKTKFSKPEYERAARRLVESSGGAFSHTVGLAVHDDGRYGSGPLQPGQVFAVDPQLRVSEEGLYMRIEDTVVVTENGVEVLTRFAPSELNEIEKLMKEEGIVQKFPPIPPIKK